MPRYRIDIEELPDPPDNGPGCGTIIVVILLILFCMKACAH